MKYAAVAKISFFDNDMKQLIVEVEDGATWKSAYFEALRLGLLGGDKQITDEETDWLESLSDDMGKARYELSGADMDICVTFFECDGAAK